MLLAPSPLRTDNTIPHDSLAAQLPDTTLPPVEHVESRAESINLPKAPAHDIHTPQQLAQLEAIAQAQTRSTPEYTTVSDEEKYLAAQLVYLASQHHGSEYNRQKINQGPQPVYVPLSIQLPSHIRDLRVRQAQSTQRQAWFIAQNKDYHEDSVPSDTETEGRVDERPTLFPQDQPIKKGLPASCPPSPRHVERRALVELHSAQVSLLQDALGNSVLPSPPDTFPNTGDSTKVSPVTLTAPSFVSKLLPTSAEVDAVDTPPLPETALPQFPPPARSRAPSHATLALPHLPSSLTPDWSTTRKSHAKTADNSPRTPSTELGFWPQPPTRPLPIHVAPIPTPQLQLALETAISKDTILDPSQLRGRSVNEQSPPGVFRHAPNSGGPVLYSTPANGLPHPLLPPRLLALPKTSETHPINISQVIPPECIAMISSHLEKYPDNSGANDELWDGREPHGSYFRIPPHLRLDHVLYVLAVRAYEARAAMNRCPPVSGQVRFEDSPRPRLAPGPGAALRSFASEPNFERPLKRPFSMDPAVPHLAIPQPKRPSNPAPDRSMDMPNSLDLDLRNNGHESPDEESHKEHSGPSSGSMEVSTETSSSPPVPSQSIPRNEGRSPIALPSLPPMLQAPPTPLLTTPQQPSPSPIGAFPIRQLPHGTPASRSRKQGPNLGNLYMSSCPGKKVRLNGPVKGRGAICRDLGVDLARIKSIGVDLIVCCLDDDELDFLGAPWPEYEDAANVVGLDVLRLPMPEGLCPLSAQSMSRHMDRIIHNYTLMGKHVLVHCRGGVGRAGLVACTWMLKLGICGSVEPTNQAIEWDQETQPPAECLMRDRRVAADTLELLERVVYVIRRQRSVKAIETYEQVRFLLEFIEHLRYTDAKAVSLS
ncbi:Dual specificity phosphatase, catalytic domain [Ceratobasidium sp. AG-Ba]|nr:Dual specificity phosphatase, catalytic domain [Ceratobasidium sp. AG-Ba]